MEAKTNEGVNTKPPRWCLSDYT
ncbi:unnamed protein product, partial [Rotaria sp. Silwood2]